MQYSPSQAFAILYDHYCAQILHFLQQSNRHFGLLCEASRVHFDPPEAKKQATRRGGMLEFMILGSTFDSLEIQQDSLGQVFVHFLVGLRPRGSGERVVMRVRGIYQIFIRDALDEERALFTRVDSHVIFADDTSLNNKESSPKLASHIQNPIELYNQQERESLQALSKNTHNYNMLQQLGFWQK